MFQLQRCDAQKPVCGPCSRSTGAFADCEYTEHGLTRTQQLEDQIAVLEARIEDLQSGSPNSMTLRNPYTGHFGQSPQSLQRIRQSRPIPATTQTPNIDIIQSARLLEESHPDLHHRLIQSFLTHASQQTGFNFGFFLDIKRFSQTVFNDHVAERPTQALLNAIYLVSSRLEGSSFADSSELRVAFVRRALLNISSGLQANCSQKVLHTIQAEVLIANYLFCNGRIMEGRYHVVAAVSLVLSARLNKMTRSGNYSGFGHSSSGTSLGESAIGTGEMLPMSRDAVEEEERIHAFWTVLWLNNVWTAVDRLPSNIAYTTANAGVDTPWPVDFSEYKEGSTSREADNGGNTVQKFLMNVPDAATSVNALYAKTGILFEQATPIAVQYRADPHSEKLQRSFVAVDSLIQRLIQHQLPPIASDTCTRSSSSLIVSPHDRLCLHTLARIVVIRLHSPFANQDMNSFARVVNAAREVAEAVRRVDIREMPTVDPILAMLWTEVCQTFVNGIRSTRGLPSSPLSATRMRTMCEEIIGAMRHFASVSSSMEKQVDISHTMLQAAVT
ncbi:hypothetical protein D9758_008179 [Tetrapyrgos nigripes]|uniref:Transcription factor domain-containing protein n=1 Tax=Tetrapyrgos nigripes TaxID=182062 RepID=A0A8H5LPS7_9AGAR|nr:hypothetical protein D9758_008179 [Tetrapyrgos nigripes]